MVITLVLVVSVAIGVAVWAKRRRHGSTLVRNVLDVFKPNGQQISGNEFRQLLEKVSRAWLEQKGGHFEIYPNKNIVLLHVPPDTRFYAYCNLMEFMDFNQTIEHEYRYGLGKKTIDLSKLPKFNEINGRKAA
jgi:hypothetical protein